MIELAKMIDRGEAPEPKDYPIIIPKISAEKPKFVTYRSATIVYDPVHIK